MIAAVQRQAVSRFYRFGPFLVDVTTRTIHAGLKSHALPEKLFEILVILLEANGTFVSRERFFEALWPDAASDGNLSQHIFLLRRALEHCAGKGEYILTASGMGYRLGATVEQKVGLTMKTSCERCGIALPPSGDAYICSYECTYCASCYAVLIGTCQNCGGKLTKRPPRN